MATNDYFIGQGELYVRQLNDDETPAEAFWGLGDADVFTTDTSTSVNKHYESNSGTRRLAASWNTQLDQTFTINVKNFNLANLAALMAGTDSGAVAGAAVVDEAVSYAYEGQVVYTAYPGISSVTVKEAGSPAVSLVAGTDYELVDNGRDGGIRIISGAPNISGSGPLNLLVSYTHVGIAGAIQALTSTFKKYEIRFNAINVKNPSTPVIVDVPVAQFYPAESVSWIGIDNVASFDFTGDILTPTDGSEPIRVTLANTVA